MKISKYGKIVLLIGLVDLLTTVIGITTGVCEETNPILKWSLAQGGVTLFAAVKMFIFLFIPVFIAELALKRSWARPKVISTCYVVVAIAYSVYYIAATIRVNFPSIRALFS
ncbi:MAG: DUF5658 family protein [Patescibacteria group bacterium]|nr:DUF5658 family protein [Patescibacteria group bacterium]